MRIDAGMDTGDMLLQRELPIGPNETTPELAAAPGGTQRFADGRNVARPPRWLHPAQAAKPADASLAPLLKKEDGRIDWELPAQTIYNRMRGFTPWPGAYTVFRGSVCQLFGQPVSR